MKYVVLIGDGMGDYPIPELGGLTPLAAAKTPNMDRLAKTSLVGLAQTIPQSLEPGSDVANMSLLGYDPMCYHTGRAPLEAASLKIELKPDQVAFRCNLVILGRDNEGRTTMADYSAGHITTEAAKPIIELLQSKLGDSEFHFYPGTSYRHLLVWTGGTNEIYLTPPHDLSGQLVEEQLDRLKEESPRLFELTRDSWQVLSRQVGALCMENPPTSIWLWGQGRPPKLPTFKERYGLTGAVISAVDLLKGLAAYSGLESIDVDGATGWLDTNYAGKVAAGLQALGEKDFLFIHVEAPDEAGHSGNPEYKVQAIEDFDANIVGPMLDGLGRLSDFRLLVACDHFTPLSVKTHTKEPVPVLIYDSRQALGGSKAYDELQAEAGFDFGPGHNLLDILLEKKKA